MKKLRFLPLLALLLLCLCSLALADGFSSQQNIAAISDANGAVTTLTDDDASTAWTKSYDNGVDLTINLYGSSVGEIWLRSGYAYTQNWYNHYSRPDVVKVTVYYRANQYTTTYDSYRYRLTDAYKPNTVSDDWSRGYQRLLLPKKYTGVTKIELTVESTITGYGKTGATISDIIIAAGSHATATPRAYATATPKPYTVYVTASPGPATATPLVEYITPRPTATAYVEPITPRPTNPQVELITPRPTATPLVELLTPPPTAVPEPTAVPTEAPTRVPVDYPTKSGIPATLLKRIATRSGPSNYFDEPGSFFSAGDEVNVISKGWDSENEIWWFQVEFMYDNSWLRAYTPANRIDLDPSLVPTEASTPIETVYSVAFHNAQYGPSYKFAAWLPSPIVEGAKCAIYAIEDGWAQVEYFCYGRNVKRRAWVPLSVLYGE